MKRIAYHKLVRDHIPEIIEAAGRLAIVRHADIQEKRRYLLEKLKEETKEFLEQNSLEELADILEVMHGLVDSMEHTWDELEAVRNAKKLERGGFENGVLLMEVIEP